MTEAERRRARESFQADVRAGHIKPEQVDLCVAEMERFEALSTLARVDPEAWKRAVDGLARAT